MLHDAIPPTQHRILPLIRLSLSIVPSSYLAPARPPPPLYIPLLIIIISSSPTAVAARTSLASTQTQERDHTRFRSSSPIHGLRQSSTIDSSVDLSFIGDACGRRVFNRGEIPTRLLLNGTVPSSTTGLPLNQYNCTFLISDTNEGSYIQMGGMWFHPLPKVKRISDIILPQMDSETPIESTPSDPQPSSSSSNVGSIIGGILDAVLRVAAIALVVFLLVRKRRQMSSSRAQILHAEPY